ncbi:SymE family type I addiction module toxin [Sodalis sp. RH16]|uniref:SymE family type I addiction module toxin n=1 Tax=Sodalis sp. RH16 TaxID=3394331 RepID=UPI0039B5E55A
MIRSPSAPDSGYAHHKSDPVISQALRRSVVGYAPDAYRYPQVKLKGKWLEQAGFF